MAQQFDMEGTSTSGEAQEFERVLTENGVAKDTIQKLSSNGLKTMYISAICVPPTTRPTAYVFHRNIHILVAVDIQ